MESNGDINCVLHDFREKEKGMKRRWGWPQFRAICVPKMGPREKLPSELQSTVYLSKPCLKMSAPPRTVKSVFLHRKKILPAGAPAVRPTFFCNPPSIQLTAKKNPPVGTETTKSTGRVPLQPTQPIQLSPDLTPFLFR